MRQFAVSLLVLFALSCVTNGAALGESRKNRIWISQVKLGQTEDQVRAIMHKGPESTNSRVLPDGTNEEVWNYLTDYENDINTSITFRNGKVVELTQMPWLGNGKFK